MPQESNDLVVGAAISLLSALLTFILSSVFQWMRENRARQWILDDRKLQRRLDTLNARLQEARKYLSDLNTLSMAFFELEMFLNLHGKPLDFDQRMTFIVKHQKDTNLKYSSMSSLGDAELAELNIQLSKLTVDEMSNLSRIYNSVSNNIAYDNNQETERLNQFMTTAIRLNNSALKRLDELSGFDN